MKFRADLSPLRCCHLHDHFFRSNATFNKINFCLMFCMIDLLNAIDDVVCIISSALNKKKLVFISHPKNVHLKLQTFGNANAARF